MTNTQTMEERIDAAPFFNYPGETVRNLAVRGALAYVQGQEGRQRFDEIVAEINERVENAAPSLRYTLHTLSDVFAVLDARWDDPEGYGG